MYYIVEFAFICTVEVVFST